jgi:hypothetical protein
MNELQAHRKEKQNKCGVTKNRNVGTDMILCLKKRASELPVCQCVCMLWKYGLWMIQMVDGEPKAKDGLGGSVLTLGAPAPLLSLPLLHSSVLRQARTALSLSASVSLRRLWTTYVKYVAPSSGLLRRLWTTHTKYVVTASMSLIGLWTSHMKYITGHRLQRWWLYSWWS